MTQYEKLISNGMEGFIDRTYKRTCPHVFGLKEYSDYAPKKCESGVTYEVCKQCFMDSFSALVDESGVEY